MLSEHKTGKDNLYYGVKNADKPHIFVEFFVNKVIL